MPVSYNNDSLISAHYVSQSLLLKLINEDDYGPSYDATLQKMRKLEQMMRQRGIKKECRINKGTCEAA